MTFRMCALVPGWCLHVCNAIGMQNMSAVGSLDPHKLFMHLGPKNHKPEQSPFATAFRPEVG